MTKKVTKNVKTLDFIEKIGSLYFWDEPTDEDMAKIVSALGDCEYQTELVHDERRRYRRYWNDDENCRSTTQETERIYILNIYKKITKEVEE